eukprot:scaffold3644_cov119-Skeletonema_dohrnii-CCMP3373.AAC.1
MSESGLVRYQDAKQWVRRCVRVEDSSIIVPGRKAVDYKIRIVRVTRTQGFGSLDPHSVGLAERSQTSLCRLRGVGGACPMAKSYRGLDRHQRDDQETQGQRHHSYRSRGVGGACPMAKSYRGLDRHG